MSELQNKVEQIIKNHIAYLTASPNHKQSTHMEQHYHTLLGELYDGDDNGIIFVNHFGHIEYMNHAFSNYFMLDKYNQDFNNILNLNRLPIEIDVNNHRFHLTYPNGSSISLSMTHQLIHFKTSTLLQFKFIDVSTSLSLSTSYQNHQLLHDFYMSHVDSSMFLINQDGLITNVATPDQLLFEHPLSYLEGFSAFEYLPFDYATELIKYIKTANNQVDSHFLYEYKHNNIVQMLSTSLTSYKDGLILCHIKDVSDLNTMSTTLEYLTDFDSLTGFHNTSYFEGYLSSLNNNDHMPLSIYVLSLQGLKNINRKVGHVEGDNLIKELALLLRSLTTQHEKLCRISGNTFVIFFPNHSKNSLDTFLLKIDKHLKQYKIKYSNHYLTYNQKSMFLTDTSDDLSTLIHGLIP